MWAREMETEEVISEEEIERIESDIEWTSKNFKHLLKTHEGKYIAVKEKNIIAESDDFEELLRKLKKDDIDPRSVHIDSITPRSFACIL